MITGHVYDNAPRYRIEERQERNEPGPAIAWADDATTAQRIASREASHVTHNGVYGIWYAVVDKDTGEVKSATQT